MRGAGGTPRGFRAHQNNLRRGRRTNEIRRTAPNRQTRHQKKGGFQQATSQKPKNPSADAITAGGSLKQNPLHQPRSCLRPDATKSSKTSATPLQRVQTYQNKKTKSQKCKSKRMAEVNNKAYPKQSQSKKTAENICKSDTHLKGWTQRWILGVGFIKL